MGMTSKRCIKCKKKRKWVDNQPLNELSKLKGQALKDKLIQILAQPDNQHDAGWRFINGSLLCGFCVKAWAKALI